jgi:hypothetical protein
VGFKFHPRYLERPPADWSPVLAALREAWVGTFLWLESRRLNSSFKSPEDYASFQGRLFPDEEPIDNILRQARDLSRGRRVAWTGTDHPRSAVWKSLALIMDPERTRGSIEAAGKRLACAGSLPLEIEERCRSAWQNYP